jgi:hypothetical protein
MLEFPAKDRMVIKAFDVGTIEANQIQKQARNPNKVGGGRWMGGPLKTSNFYVEILHPPRTSGKRELQARVHGSTCTCRKGHTGSPARKWSGEYIVKVPPFDT